MPGLNLVEVLNPKSKERGILRNKCFMKSTHSMVMPTEIWQFSVLSLSLLYFPVRASGHTIEPCCSCPCLWSLIHHFSDITSLCLEEASRRDTTFPEFPPLCLYFCFQFTCCSFSLLSPCLSHCVSFLTTISHSVTWVENDPAVCWGEVLVLLKWSTLTLASLDNLCMSLLQRSAHFSLVVEVVGFRCFKIFSRLWTPLKTGLRAIPHVLVIAHGETFEREQLSASVELWCIIIQQFPHFV